MGRTSTARAVKRGPELGSRIALPKSNRADSAPLAWCLATRRSCRAYEDASIRLEQAARLLWAGQGITGLGGLRTAPSARAIHPLRLYLLAPQVEGLDSGIYRYDPDEHELELLATGDRRRRLAQVSFNQEWIEDAPAAILIAADFSLVVREFGDRAQRLVCYECGHAAQNMCLEATAQGLGVITVSAFDPAGMRRLAEVPETQEPMYLVVAGEKM